MIPRAIIRICAISLALELALLTAVASFRPRSVVSIDSGTYIRPAKALLETGHFSPSVSRAPEPEINRTPGYPLLIAAVFTLFGERPLLLSALGALFSTVTLLLLSRLTMRLFGGGEAVVAALLLSLDFGSFYCALDVLTDTTFTCLLLLGLVLLVEAFEASSSILAGASGLAFAVATHVRPISFYLLPVLTAVLLVARWRHGGGRAVRFAGAFALPCILLVGGWVVRNGLRAGTWLFSPIARSELLFYRGAKVLSLATGASYPEVQERLGNRERWWREGGAEREEEIFGSRSYAELYPKTSRLPLAELEARWGHQALAIFRRYPAGTLLMVAEGAALLLLAPPPLIFSVHYGLFSASPRVVSLYERQDLLPFVATLARESPILAVASFLTVVYLALVVFLAMRGLFRANLSAHRPGHAAILTALLYLLAVSSGPQANDDRFRLPLMPLLCLYAGAGLRIRRVSPIGCA